MELINKQENKSGFYAETKYIKGDLICLLSDVETNKIINHSFTPNVYIDGNELIALDTINVNDELTINYNKIRTFIKNHNQNLIKINNIYDFTPKYLIDRYCISINIIMFSSLFILYFL